MGRRSAGRRGAERVGRRRRAGGPRRCAAGTGPPPPGAHRHRGHGRRDGGSDRARRAPGGKRPHRGGDRADGRCPARLAVGVGRAARAGRTGGLDRQPDRGPAAPGHRVRRGIAPGGSPAGGPPDAVPAFERRTPARQVVAAVDRPRARTPGGDGDPPRVQPGSDRVRDRVVGHAPARERGCGRLPLGPRASCERARYGPVHREVGRAGQSLRVAR